MKTEAMIYLDYQKTMREADQLKAIASRLKTLSSSDLENCLGQVSSHWEGDNARAYVTKGRTVSEKITKTAAQLDRAADTIRIMAKNTYDAEMRALQIARQGH